MWPCGYGYGYSACGAPNNPDLAATLPVALFTSPSKHAYGTVPEHGEDLGPLPEAPAVPAVVQHQWRIIVQ